MNYVMCLKWGTKYSAEYVNNLYSMVKKHTTINFAFICFTDDASGIDENIIIMPLIDDNLMGWWGKISYFKNPLFDLSGTALTLDLDMVIVDNIDCFFEHKGEFCIMKDRQDINGNNTSIIRFEINKHGDIYDDLDLKTGEFCTGIEGDPLWRNKYWGDQVWVTERRPNAINFPKKWISSYKHDCLTPRNEFFIPDGCKIVLFHGKPNPHEVRSHIQHLWK